MFLVACYYIFDIIINFILRKTKLCYISPIIKRKLQIESKPVQYVMFIYVKLSVDCIFLFLVWCPPKEEACGM